MISIIHKFSEAPPKIPILFAKYAENINIPKTKAPFPTSAKFTG